MSAKAAVAHRQGDVLQVLEHTVYARAPLCHISRERLLRGETQRIPFTASARAAANSGRLYVDS